jgi:L-ribulokinase
VTTSQESISQTGAPLALGVDYGTESGRVLVLDLVSGAELAASVVPYAHGVIDDKLPDSGIELGHDWALQHPLDYLEVLEKGIPAALGDAGVDPQRVIGIGTDFTACTVLPTLADGTPLCTLEQWRDHPNAWTKLWKHHAAQRYADRLTEVAAERGESFLSRYGGRISSEWYFPKLIQVFEEDREVYDATERFIEAADWIIWQLTGNEVRSTCAAGYKGFWSPTEGIPSEEYFGAAFPDFAGPGARYGSNFAPLGARAGTVRPELAARLGLRADVAVAVGNVDSFVSFPGCGVESTGSIVSVIGTSICDMVIHPEEIRLPGITGVVKDGIFAGSYGYEAGQPAVGDMFAWFVDRLLATAGAGRGARYAELESAAENLAPGSTGLVALAWWNGNRSILADADLSGAMIGMTLSTTPEEVYRALLESVAFGARRIIDNFTDHGLGIERIVACGGIAEKSSALMQMYADATGLPVDVPASPQIPARGSALFGAVAAGADAGGFDDIADAVAALRPGLARSYQPRGETKATYDEVYRIYAGLHDALGRENVNWMHALKQIRRAAR